mmetsp:Transcript_39199/g.103725  ORF Transcript_39199/g.103725 Transcript_39199/m.103725 type:complete len:128 (+) Transcript_39199:420-803(+)
MGIIFVYDVTNEASFRNIEEWVRNVEKHAAPNVNKILIGNKCDLKSQRRVTEEEGKKLAERMKMTFFETSAASSGNVDQAFLELARLVKDRISDCGTPYPDPPTVKVVDMSKPVCSGGLACGSCRPL